MSRALLRSRKGISFIESILALLILSLGIFAYISLFAEMSTATIEDELASTASRLANQKLEEVLATKANLGYAQVNLGTTTENITYANHAYVRQTSINYVSVSDLQTLSGSDTGIKKVDVTVSWSDRSTRQIQLTSVVANY